MIHALISPGPEDSQAQGAVDPCHQLRIEVAEQVNQRKTFQGSQTVFCSMGASSDVQTGELGELAELRGSCCCHRCVAEG